MEPAPLDEPSLLTFAALVFATVCWVVLVVLLLPRVLGRLLAFLANRASRGAFHVVIPTLHIYPLAGRAVAHSLRYTLRDGTISAEELVLQIRWWRKAPVSQFRQLLAVDDAHTLDPVAHAQQQLQRENSAFVIKRLWFRLRRWWRRAAGPTDSSPAGPEPPPLISLIAVGLRARLVNVQANYDHVTHVLNLAKASSHRSASRRAPDASSGLDSRFDIPLPADPPQSPSHSGSATSSASSYTSAESVEAKPFRQRVAELVSLRITSGSFYFCDMGESPLVRVVVDSAKVRYRYGAPACPIDECRKRFRVRVSGLRVSVADHDTVCRIVEPATANVAPRPVAPFGSMQDKTDRMIRRVVNMGHRGIGDPHIPAKDNSASRKRPRGRPSELHSNLPPSGTWRERRPSFRYQSRSQAWEARRTHDLPCADILTAETAVVDYVFDEPGLAPLRKESPLNVLGERAIDFSSEGNTEDTSSYPAPVCRVSVLLRGASFSYDTKAVADIERILERLQPAFYDLMPLAMKEQARDGKRAASGIQIEVDATPIVRLPSRNADAKADIALISIPFDPEPATWEVLSTLNIRRWPKSNDQERYGSAKGNVNALPPSRIDIHAQHVSVRTEVPYRIGAQQKTVIAMRRVNAATSGIVEMPLCHAKNVVATRVLQFPQIWNEVHSSSAEVLLKDCEVIYLPDTVRVLDDLSSTIAANSKRPQDVRYFVPFKDTTRIRAESKYSVILSCSHDNAWDEIHTLQADQYGKMKVCGDTAELVLSQNVPTEFCPDATVLSWMLSLPSATGVLELPLPYKTLFDRADGVGLSSARPSESERSAHHKSRPPSLARRMRSQLETFASHHHQEDATAVKLRAGAITIDVLQAGKVCKLTGKVVVNEGRKYLGSRLLAFLDSVDRSDVSLKASSLAIDVNPHHVSHLLNMARNYAGSGSHVISTAERHRLHLKRKELAGGILDERRYPFVKECVILGLGAAQTLISVGHRKAMDDLLCMSFQVDALVVRLHDLPHALSPFNKRSKNVCSLECRRFFGSLQSTRLGLELRCSPESKNKSLILHGEYRNTSEEAQLPGNLPSSGNLTSPTATIEQFQIRKRSISSPDWGAYSSDLTIEIGNVRGCLLDVSALCLSRFCLSSVPHPLQEDQLAAAALLSVDNVEVKLSTADVLILSTSSNASAERSGQVSKLSLLRHEIASRGASPNASTPTFLTGVIQLQAPVGLRFVMSNLASEAIATQSRLIVPDLSVDLLMSWGGRLSPWVDDATLRAQVAHAILVRGGNPQSTFQDGGLMRRAAEVRETNLEVVFDSRPRMWSQTVAELQKHYISHQNKKIRGDIPIYCRSSSSSSQENHVLSAGKELELTWWQYLQRSRRASILKKHVETDVSRHGKFDSMSIGIVSNATILLSPESLELANDIVIRCKESLLGQESTILQREQAVSDQRTGDRIILGDVAEMWHMYEASSPPRWTLPGEETSGVLIRALETKGLKLLLMSPVLPGEIQSGGELFPFEAGEEDGVHVSAPFGVHMLDVGTTEVPAMKRMDGLFKTIEPPSNVRHTTVIHSSIPLVSVGCNDKDLGQIDGVVVIFRQQSTIKRRNESREPFEEIMREDKETFVGKIESICIGKPNSSLQLYACFGRIASIFSLMSRALALENASLLKAKNSRMEQLAMKILPVSVIEFGFMGSDYVRTFLSRVSKFLIDRERELADQEKGVSFTEDFPKFVREEAPARSDIVTHSIVSSINLTLHNLSLQLADEDIVRADAVLCKGGSTARSQTLSALDGHVLNASFGTIALSIRDDIAANTLRMVSEVASFVRRATISMPMLRYEGHHRSRETDFGSSELLSYSYMHEELLKASVATSLEHGYLLAQPRGRIHLPMPSHVSSGRNRGHWYSHTRTRAGNRYGERDRTRLRSLRTDSQGTSSRNSEMVSPTGRKPLQPIPLHRSQFGEQDILSDSDPREGNTAPIDTGYKHLSGARATADRRRTRPKSSGEVDHRLTDPSGWFAREDMFEEDNQYFAYVAIPTAGETGPPRKRAKSRVRVSPLVPPAFSNLDQIPSEHPSRRDNSTSQRQQFSVSLNRTLPHGILRGAIGRSPGSGSEPPRASPKEHFDNVASTTGDQALPVRPPQPLRPKKRPAITLFVSCREILSQYFRRKSLPDSVSLREEKEADIKFSVREPRLTFMSAPSKGSQSVVITASSAGLQSANNPNCILAGSIASIGVTVSIAQGFVPSSLPKLIASARVSEFKTTLHATDLKSVLKFREEFKSDLKAVLSAFVTTKSSISEMARATRLSSSKILYPGRTLFSTMAFDLLCEQSRVKLQGFHPKDSAMCMSYLLDGLFFSVVASEDDNAALTLGLRLYGHGLSLSSPSWPSDEVFHFPSFDARGVQWGETTGLPTLLKVSAEPLINSTSIQGLRHVTFTVAGLMAFQSTSAALADLTEEFLGSGILAKAPELKEFYSGPHSSSHTAGATPFSRSFAAWERTKGVRMDLSIRPMSINLASGQVVARFDVEAITGIFEWNKLVVTGVQLHTAVSIPRISLMFMRMPSLDFTYADIRPDERRASMYVALEKSRLDVLKTQEDLTHTFTFRIDIFAVSGQLRPWRLLLDAAVWADEQEFVSDLQSINYGALSSTRPRTPKSPWTPEPTKALEHRIILIGANVQRFKLAVPLLNSEEYSSSRLALRATELHFLARQRFDSLSTPRKNVLEVKSHFIGVLWENTALLSSHHARITLGAERPSLHSNAHFGAVQIVMVAGTWRICPRKDVVMAMLEAKNARDNKHAAEMSRDVLSSFPDVLSRGGSSIAGDSLSNTTERQGRLLVESMRLKILRTSGFIEGLEGDAPSQENTSMGLSHTSSRIHTTETSKLTVPAFSIAIVREETADFDLVDIDFSGREGEFPRQCLQKVSNLFSELFGAVASNGQEEVLAKSSTNPAQQSREISRDTSILIRFGKSLYRAQEEVNNSVESKFCFFAGRSSSILASLTTKPLFEDELGHSTVISGISPKLALEITPLIEGAKVQSLRLIDARFVHGISPCRPPHSLLHIARVTALMDAKTVLLTQRRIQARKLLREPVGNSEVYMKSSLPAPAAERNLMIVLGRPRKSDKVLGTLVDTTHGDSRVEPDIRLQLKLPPKNESPTDQVDIFVDRLYFGFCQTRRNPYLKSVPLTMNVALHEMNLRGQWDIVSCRLRLRENLFSCKRSGESPVTGGFAVVTNIMNRLHFESMQYGNHTMKLGVDAVAAVCSAPSRDVLIESTTVNAEVSHTMIKSIVRLTGQVKKLRGEVKLLVEREMSRDAKRNAQPKLYSSDGRSGDSTLPGQEAKNPEQPGVSGSHVRSMSVSSIRTEGLTKDEKLKRSGKKTKVCIKGDGLSAVMRGYQFEETQHSAMISLERYEVGYEYDCNVIGELVHIKQLGIDFSSMKMTYNDDERAIHSDLFKVPNPKLRLKVVDSETGLTVELLGDLEVKLGPGFYHWQDFKKLSELTIHGIMPAHDPTETVAVPPAPDRPEVWDGRLAQVSVRLNPRIDVIGDLTADMLQFMNAKRGRVDIVPKHLYDYVVVYLDSLSEALCDPLFRELLPTTR